MKRIFDIVASLTGLLVFLPILLIVSVAIALESPGTVFFRQERVGLGGRNFSILKFRSMVRDAEKIGSYQTKPGDARITRVGAFLRRTSLDELPQLFNVLRGEMSLVGPRPDVPLQRNLYTEDEWQRRTSVRPGITGLAQATFRSEAKEGQRKSLDLEYVDRQSFSLDIKILFLTLKQIFLKGSY